MAPQHRSVDGTRRDCVDPDALPAYSMAAVLVSPITPCFVAVYAACFGSGRNEFVEAMLTIEPPAPLQASPGSRT